MALAPACSSLFTDGSRAPGVRGGIVELAVVIVGDARGGPDESFAGCLLSCRAGRRPGSTSAGPAGPAAHRRKPRPAPADSRRRSRPGGCTCSCSSSSASQRQNRGPQLDHQAGQAAPGGGLSQHGQLPAPHHEPHRPHPSGGNTVMAHSHSAEVRRAGNADWPSGPQGHAVIDDTEDTGGGPAGCLIACVESAADLPKSRGLRHAPSVERTCRHATSTA